MKHIIRLKNEFHLRYCNHSYKEIFFDVLNLEDEDVLSYVNTNLQNLKNSIAYSNPELSDNIDRYEDLSQKQIHSLAETVFNYISRSVFRPVPYGDFVSVMLGFFSKEKTENNLKEYNTHVAVSNNWIGRLEKLSIEQENVLKKIKVIKSQFVVVRNNYIFLYDSDTYGDHDKEKKIKITPLLQFILNVCKGYIETERLIDLIIKEFHFENSETIYKFIRDLIREKLLVPDLHLGNISSEGKLNSIISLWEKDKRSDLIGIQNLLERFNSNEDFDTNEKTTLLNQITEMQKKIIKSDKYLYINSYNPSEFNLLSSYKNEIEKAGNLLMLFTRTNNYSKSFSKYNKYFDNLKDSFSSIKLLELIHETFNNGSQDMEMAEEITNYVPFAYLVNKIQYLSQTNIDVAEISDEEIQELLNFQLDNSNYDNYPAFDAIFSLHLKDDVLNIIYKQNTIMNDNGNALSRFTHIPEILEKIVSNDYGFNNSKISNAVLYDVNVDSDLSDLSNQSLISSVPIINLSDTNLSNSVKIDNLFVHRYDEKFHLYDKKNKMFFLPKQTNLVNGLTYYSRLYSMIYKVRFQFINQKHDIFEALLERFYYVPRIVYKSITLMKRTWRIQYTHLSFHEKKVTTKTLGDFFSRIGLPKIVGIVENSDTIYYNRLNNMHLKLMMKQIRQYGYLTLVESNYEYGEVITEKFTSEFVFSFVNSKPIVSIQPPIFLTEQNNGDNLPEESWLTIKFYFSEKLQKEFLELSLPSIISYFKDLNYQQFFYIRYYDPHFHIRFRIKKSKLLSEENLNINIMKLWDIVQETSNIALEDINVGLFHPEYSRYGGPSLMNMINNFFCSETETVLHEINKYSEERLVAYIYNYLTKMGFTKLDIYECLIVYKRYNYLEGDTISNFIELIQIESEQINNSGQEWIPKLNYEVMTKKSGSNSKEYMQGIIRSIIHMSINRIQGIDRGKENGVLRKLFEFSRINNFSCNY